MTSVFENVLSAEDIQYLNQLPEVLEAKAKLNTQQSSGSVYFTIRVTETIRTALETRFGLNLSGVSEIPMRWMKGDTAPHVDIGRSNFENTYLVYLNSSAGEIVIGEVFHSITENTGYVFQEGISHKTTNTGQEPRLILGPMNEFAQPVGASVTFYYPSEADALATTSEIAQYGDYTVQLVSGFTHWRIASNSTGPSPQNVVYTVGDTLAGNYTGQVYYLYPVAPCFREGSTILCLVDGVEKYVPVEQLTKDTQVKTSLNGYKKVAVIAKADIKNPGNDERIQNRLYKCSTSKYPALKEDLYITGCHSILEFPITEKQKADTIKNLGKLFVTDKKYRLMACLDDRAEPWNSEGTYKIYHFALDDVDEGINFGVYANGGLLVETCAIRTLKYRSNMTPVV